MVNNPSEKLAQRALSLATVHPPPCFAPLTRNTPHVDPNNDPTQDMVGQVVTGVVQATFDAGYLLSIRIGNSDTTLTGAVFQPGHAAPITLDNDVTPHAEMIKRAEIPFPAYIQPKRKRKQISKEKNMQLVTYVGNGFEPMDTTPPPPETSSDIGDMSEPLFVEPLQTRHPVQHFQPSPVLGGVMHGERRDAW
ncbi:uncharacterized protein LOC143555855 [Bidens hawaiensis]|uniref:uncharacterized protein LOC143555855 n=1 Tax=Bidens hawaiensis TaxID=980011 RepID=UPI004049C079